MPSRLCVRLPSCPSCECSLEFPEFISGARRTELSTPGIHRYCALSYLIFSRPRRLARGISPPFNIANKECERALHHTVEPLHNSSVHRMWRMTLHKTSQNALGHHDLQRVVREGTRLYYHTRTVLLYMWWTRQTSMDERGGVLRGRLRKIHLLRPPRSSRRSPLVWFVTIVGLEPRRLVRPRAVCVHRCKGCSYNIL